MGWRKRTMVAAGVGACALMMTAAPVRADVVDPPGACTGQGTWASDGKTYKSTDYSPDDVITIPQKDTVAWEGAIKGYAVGDTGPRREISGEVEVDVAGLFSIPVDDWGGSSERYANQGEHEYDAPDTLVGIKIKLKGEHREAPEGSSSFTKVCSGSVYLKIDGSNPATVGALVLAVLSGGLMLYSGVVKKKWAYEDTNPG